MSNIDDQTPGPGKDEPSLIAQTVLKGTVCQAKIIRWNRQHAIFRMKESPAGGSEIEFLFPAPLGPNTAVRLFGKVLAVDAVSDTLREVTISVRQAVSEEGGDAARRLFAFLLAQYRAQMPADAEEETDEGEDESDKGSKRRGRGLIRSVLTPLFLLVVLILVAVGGFYTAEQMNLISTEPGTVGESVKAKMDLGLSFFVGVLESVEQRITGSEGADPETRRRLLIALGALLLGLAVAWLTGRFVTRIRTLLIVATLGGILAIGSGAAGLVTRAQAEETTQEEASTWALRSYGCGLLAVFFVGFLVGNGVTASVRWWSGDEEDEEYEDS